MLFSVEGVDCHLDMSSNLGESEGYKSLQASAEISHVNI